MADGRRLRELVLVGGGHTHVQILRAFAMRPPPDVRTTVVLDRPIAVYSGMVPGFVAGQYVAAELEIDVVPLARRAGARVILAAATGVVPPERRILLAGRPAIAYDLASFDIGSTVAGLDVPGVREHALATRPIGRFVESVDELAARAAASGETFRTVVVGGGAAGVELAFTFDARLERAGTGRRLTLLEDSERVLAGFAPSLERRALAEARRRGIEVATGRRVVEVAADAVVLEGGERLPAAAVLWAAGAAGTDLFRDSGLPVDERGFVWTRPSLQIDGHDDLFAVGDCGTQRAHPGTPKAGVYAVRQGPYLERNLRARLAGRKLVPYRPQRQFLTLLNLGDGQALGSKWSVSFGGPAAMRLKDRIDRRFMRRFQVLAGDGRLTEAFARLPAMGDGEEMLCGGCAAKLGQGSLERVLARLGPPAPDPQVALGIEAADDVAAVNLPGGRVVVSSLDAFRAFTDDPHLVGRVAAVNAASDLWAKGVAPRFAHALVALPEDADRARREEILYQVLAGARAAFDGEETTLLGGHTTTAPGLLVGFHLEGVAEFASDLMTLAALAPGCALVLTKPLGTGVLFHADMQGRARGPWIESAIASMLASNAAAARLARAAGAAAATDVTGFGLAGHLGRMAAKSGVTAVVDVDRLPALPGALELLAQGLRSTFHEENARARRGIRVEPAAAVHPRLELLFDPQTSGGLVLGVPPDRAERLLASLAEAGYPAATVIGTTEARTPQATPLVARAG